MDQHFGTAPTGEKVRLFALANNRGLEVEIIDYGGIIVAIKVPDRFGNLADVVLGHDALEGYLNRSQYFGALIGRYANRICRGRFPLNGVEYSLATNNGENHLHGGNKGFDKVMWTVTEISDGIELSYASRDGEEGYPGNLTVKVRYVLTARNELRIEYAAQADRDTIINLTNHSYFNLAGAGTILDHEVQINADAFTPVDEGLIPTGEIRAVSGTPMDFTSAFVIGSRIDSDYDQLRHARGYDHNFVLRSGSGEFRTAAKVYEPNTGRILEVLTTQPGMQFYSGNFLNGSIVGKRGWRYVKHSGCCLEAQHFPDSPNHSNFPSTVLRPNERYQHTTIFRFSID